MEHDRQYDKGVITRHEADKQMLDSLNALPNKQLTWNEWFAKYFTKGIIGVKYKLGLGLAEELNKPIRHKFKKRRVMVFSIDDIWAADLKFKQSLSKENKEYKYLLNIIDLFSKTAYSIPLKSKSPSEIISAFEKLFKSTNRKPKKLWIDEGTEFVNTSFKRFLRDSNIELYHVYNTNKSCVVERLNRTLEEMIQKHLTSRNSSKYIDILQTVLEEYNNKTHSSIKMSPYEASLPENSAQVFANLYSNTELKKPSSFKIGDRVRVSTYKTKLNKGTRSNWTREIFVITNIKNTNPITYTLKDLKDEPILGSFYAEELQKTKF